MRPPELFTARLRLRPVAAADLDAIVRLGEDERVMATLGGRSSREASVRWLDTQLARWQDGAFGRYALEHNGVFVGLVGLARTDFEAGFTPSIQIAWRLVFDHWGKGYATEAARAVLRDGFERLGFGEIVAVTAEGNTRSRRVMERLGMIHSPTDTFEHPLVPEGDPLRLHVVYRLLRSTAEDGARRERR